MAIRRRRERLSQLNKRGHAPRLSETLDDESGNGYILEWNTSTESFDLSSPSDVGSAKTSPNISLVQSTVVYTEDSVVVGSFFPFNPTDYTAGATVRFQAGLSVQACGTGRVRLFNLTDKEYVTTAVLSSTGLGPTMLAATLTVGNGAGELKNAAKDYEVRMDVTIAGGGSRYAIFGFVGLRVVT